MLSPITILTFTYYEHWCKLSGSIHILSRNVIKKPEIELCRATLNEFVMDVRILYGIEYCTYNIHLLSHLCDSIERYGPEFGFSLFTFENFNQILLKSQLGTQAVPSQMIKYYMQKMRQNQIEAEPSNKFYSLYTKFIKPHREVHQKIKKFDINDIGLSEDDLEP